MNHVDYFDAYFDEGDDHFKYKLVQLHKMHALPNGKYACGCVTEEQATRGMKFNPDCPAVGKHPRSSNWQSTRRMTEDEFEHLSDKLGWFNHGFGVLCDGLLIIDVDKKNGGYESFEKLCRDTGINFRNDGGFVVKTGGGGLHIYYMLEGNDQLRQTHKNYPGIDFKSTGFVVGCGSMHGSGNLYECESGSPDALKPAPKDLVELLSKESAYREAFDSQGMEIPSDKIAAMLAVIDPDCDYEDWVHIGMAIHHETDGDGFDLWDEWSQNGSKYNKKEMDFKWHSFGKSSGEPITIGTLIKIAEDNGYVEPVTFEWASSQAPAEIVEVSEEAESKDTSLTLDLLDTSWVDLRNPPGLVGEISKHITSSADRPLLWCSIGSALQILSNCLGMQYKTRMGASLNLYTFMIAKSSSGKGHCFEGMQHEYMRYCGLKVGYVSQMKSAQEITRNLIENQMLCYIIDEFGLELKQIVESKNDYKSAIIAELLKAYSNSGSGEWGLSGDAFRDVKEQLKKKIAYAQKCVDENENIDYNRERLEIYKGKLNELVTRGIVGRHITVSGCTQPEMFLHLMSKEMVETGFLGRAIVFEDDGQSDKYAFPDERNGSRKIPDSIGRKLLALCTQGHSKPLYNEAIEAIYYDREPEDVPVTDEAIRAIKQVRDYFYELELQESEREHGGLEALLGRATEATIKVASLLGLGDEKIIDVKHIQWAFELIKRDQELKLSMVRGNELDRKNEVGEWLLTRLRKVPKQGWTLGYAANRITKKGIDKKKIQMGLDHLVSTGELDKQEVTNGNRTSIKYFLK